jgi:hypothetical protein
MREREREEERKRQGEREREEWSTREREFTKERERKCVGVCEYLGENESQNRRRAKR